MRTMYCGDLNISHVGSEVTLCGWVNRCRFFGNFIFVEIRDREGNVQIFFDSNQDRDIFLSASELRIEFCLQVTGIVRIRPMNQINYSMKTGEIEILVLSMKIINSSEPLPLDLNKDNSEEQRLKYRYLDLRRSEMFQRLKNRSRITSYIHRFMEVRGFLNIETPMLTHITPEGARDYLVPSRLHKGKFYALPQSPQIFKQLLMIAGFDRYYQITKCFRDEDMRSDRQPEFTQLDLETSFMTSEEVREIVECLIRDLWCKILEVELKQFPQLTYKEVMDKFASDSPDLRNPIEIFYIFDITLEQVKYNFSIVEKRDVILKTMVMNVPGGVMLSIEVINQYVNGFKMFGGKNLTWMRVTGHGYNKKIEGTAIDFFDFSALENILFKTNISEYDLLFLSCENSEFSNRALNWLRSRLGNDLKLIDKNSWCPLWVIDFPLFKKSDQGGITAMHHLFTSPKNVDVKTLLEDPLSVMANSFDMVINGCEVGSGSVRIHSCKIQKIIFDILGFSEDFQKSNFGFFLSALKYGAPIHAGMACGVDRLSMLLNGTKNIRDVIAFPKTTNAVDLMTGTPNYFNENH